MSSITKENEPETPELVANSKKSTDVAIGCDLESEINEDDELLLKELDLTEEQLKLKESNKQEFWKSVAETTRVDLQDLLDDNQEVNKIISKRLYFEFKYN
jgi:hypothetical protein